MAILHALVCILLAAGPPGPSPGPASLVRLLDPGTPVAAAALLGAALKDADPRMRAVAARLANVLDQKSLADDMAAALAVETDLDAGREMVRALAALGGKDAPAALLKAAARPGDLMLEEALIALARARGREALDLYFSKNIPDSAVREPDFFRLAVRGDSELMMKVAARTLENRVAFFPTIMAMADEESIPVEESILAQALTHPERSIRALTVIWMIQWSWERSYVDRPALLAALEACARMDNQPGGGSAHGLWLELLARIMGRTPREDASRIARLKAMNGLTEVLAAMLTRHMTPAEQQAAGDRFKPGQVVTALWPPNPSRHRLNLHRCLDLPPGFADSIQAQSGCKPQAHPWTVQAVVTYDEAGRPQEVRISSINMFEPVPDVSCATAVRRLLKASLATDGYPTRPRATREFLLGFAFPQGQNARLEENTFSSRSLHRPYPCSENADPRSPRGMLERLADFRSPASAVEVRRTWKLSPGAGGMVPR